VSDVLVYSVSGEARPLKTFINLEKSFMVHQSMSVGPPCVVATGRGGTATGVLLGAGCGWGDGRGGDGVS
jgi:hypothetical protein